MKRVVEFNTDFKIPKKTKSDTEPDLYSQVISDHQFNNFQAPGRYGISNKTLNQHPSNQKSSQNSGDASVFMVDYNNLPCYNSLVSTNDTVTVSATAAEQLFPNSQSVARTPPYGAIGLPKEIPKLGNTYKSTLAQHSDPSLPKVLTIQFQPLYCKLCDAQLSSNVTAKLHYDSKKHNKKVRQFLIDYAEETGEPLHPKASATSTKSKFGQLEDDPKFYHCTVCDLPLTGRLHAESHYMGRNHRRALAGDSPAGRGHFDSTGKWVREIALKGLPERDNFGIDFVTPLTATPVMIPMKKDLNVKDLHCELCNVAVTSDEQMALHINGQKHRRRLNQSFGVQVVNTALGAAVVSTFPDVYQTNIDMTPYRTPSGNFYCEPCNTTVNGEIPFRQHLNSKRHKKGPGSGPSRRLKPASTVPPFTAPKAGEKFVNCHVCNVPITSEMQRKIHFNGHKHKRICEERGLENPLSSNGVADNQQYFKYRTPSGQYYCKRCNLTLNTEAQFKSHITGKKHWSKISQAVGAAPTTPSK